VIQESTFTGQRWEIAIRVDSSNLSSNGAMVEEISYMERRSPMLRHPNQVIRVWGLKSVFTFRVATFKTSARPKKGNHFQLYFHFQLLFIHL